MTKLFAYLLSLVKKRWTGQVVLNFHKGKFMKAVGDDDVMTINVKEKKEVKL